MSFYRDAIFSTAFSFGLTLLCYRWRVRSEPAMDIEKLAEELAGLQYDTLYRFENGTAFHSRLSRGDAFGLLLALRQRGYAVVREAPPHVESPTLCDGARVEEESTR
jgi:hypothetical protein